LQIPIFKASELQIRWNGEGDMKANGTRWGWQNPRFGTSGLQIRWSGEFFYALISRFVLFIPLFYEKIFIFATNLKI